MLCTLYILNREFFACHQIRRQFRNSSILFILNPELFSDIGLKDFLDSAGYRGQIEEGALVHLNLLIIRKKCLECNFMYL
jgi:hypothetical protein